MYSAHVNCNNSFINNLFDKGPANVLIRVKVDITNQLFPHAKFTQVDEDIVDEIEGVLYVLTEDQNYRWI